MTADMSYSGFVPRSGDTWDDPWPMYRWLREHDPVHHAHAPEPDGDEPGDYYVLSRHADVLAALRDSATFSSASGLTTVYGELERTGLQDNPPMVMQDPPQHTEFRRLVSRGFTPRQVTAVEPAVRAFVVERIERLRASGGGDIVAELFKPLPSMVVAHYLGVPEEDRPRFDDWTERIVGAAAEAGTDIAAMGPEVAVAIGELMGYFGELVQRRQREPGDDTISHLVAAGYGADGDVAGMLSILGFAFTMVTGGNDTTTGMLGGATALLAQHPDQRRTLASDTDLIPDAVEEFLRLTSPVQGLARTPTRDVTIEGVTIPAGRKTLLLYGSANRDEQVFGPTAEHLDVRRRPREILSFAQGNHHCLGAAAARMQARVALHETLTRLPDLDVDLDSLVWSPGNYVRRPVSLRVTVS